MLDALIVLTSCFTMKDDLYCTFYGTSIDWQMLERAVLPYALEMENKAGETLKHHRDEPANFDSARIKISHQKSGNKSWNAFTQLMKLKCDEIRKSGCDEVDILIVKDVAAPYAIDSEFADALNGFQWNLTYLPVEEDGEEAVNTYQGKAGEPPINTYNKPPRAGRS